MTRQITLPQPGDIERYLKGKGKQRTDSDGWCGDFIVSAKNILDMLIDMSQTFVAECEWHLVEDEWHRLSWTIEDEATLAIVDTDKCEIVELLERDEHGHPIKAIFKLKQ